MITTMYPAYHGEAHLSTTSPDIIVLFACGLSGVIAGAMLWWLETADSFRYGDDGRFRQAKRFRVARRASAADARDDEDLGIRVRIVAPPGGLVPGWGRGAAVWTKLLVKGGGREDFVEERGEILVEDAAGTVIDVSSDGLEFAGLYCLDFDPALRYAEGKAGALPARITNVLRERGYPFAADESKGFEVAAQTEQLLPGEEVWLVGPIRRIGGSAIKASINSDYRGSQEAARFVSEGADRFVVRAESEEQATAQLAAAASNHVDARRRRAAWIALTTASLVACLYAYAMTRF